MFLKRRLIAVGPRFALELALLVRSAFFLSLLILPFLHLIYFLYILRRHTVLSFDCVFAGLQTHWTSVCSIVFFLSLSSRFNLMLVFGVLYEFVVFSLNLNRISSRWTRHPLSLPLWNINRIKLWIYWYDSRSYVIRTKFNFNSNGSRSETETAPHAIQFSIEMKTTNQRRKKATASDGCWEKGKT